MGSVRIFLMGVCGGNSLCCVLFLFGVFDNMPPNIWSYSAAPPSRSHVSSSRAHRLSRLTAPRAARCRGGSRRRGRSGRVWDLACIRFGCKKPQSLSAYCRKLRGSASDRSFAFGSARPSFLLSQVSSSLAPGLSLFEPRATRLRLTCIG